jgi:hypothetical protein
MYSSTCFGRPHAHHQELNSCSSSLWSYCWSFVVAVLLVVVGAVTMPDPDQQHWYHKAPTVRPEAATAVVELLMMGVRTPETCWAVNKLQLIKLENLLHLVGWFIWNDLLCHFVIRPFFCSFWRSTDRQTHIYYDVTPWYRLYYIAICPYDCTVFKFSTWLTHFNTNRINSSSVGWLWVPVSPYAWPANTN